MTESTFLPLNLPVGSSRAERAKFLRLCRALSESPASGSTHARWLERAGLGDIYAQPALAAVYAGEDTTLQRCLVEMARAKGQLAVAESLAARFQA